MVICIEISVKLGLVQVHNAIGVCEWIGFITSGLYVKQKKGEKGAFWKICQVFTIICYINKK